MEDDDMDFDSWSEQERKQRRKEKRPAAQELDDELEAEMEEDLRRRRNQAQQTKSTGESTSASTRHAQEDDDGEDENQPGFRPETMQAIFKGVWTDPGIKAQKDAMELSAEFLRLFTIEALHRTAAYQREQEDEELKDDETLIELDSLEAITPQLLMDF
ncbi:hypothetical protein BGZ83_008423 [Gryganskiella cystojenkinii]|nr:hypothetical protein BGZ83_008423 [Gryganskiella cystojenkinii]